MAKDVTDIILERINQIDTKVETLITNGCTRARTHESIEHNQNALFKRVNSLELTRAESKGKLAVAVAVSSSIITVVATWLGKFLFSPQ